MELKHDWRAFNSVLFPQDSWSNTGGAVTTRGRMVLVENNGRVEQGIVSNGVSFADQGVDSPEVSKERLDSLASKYGVEQTYVVESGTLQQAIADSAIIGSNYYQQIQLIRERLTQQNNKQAVMVSKSHFLLDFLTGYAAKVLPRSYNFLIFIDASVGFETQYKALLVHMNQGKVEEFYEPDFSSLHENRLEEWSKSVDIIGEYLENRYLLPCFGLFIKRAAWTQCLEAASQGQTPWKPFFKAIDTGSAAVYPQNFTMKSLLAAQRVKSLVLKPNVM